MATTHVSAFESTLQKTHAWLDELVRDAGYEDESQAYTALRAVLHVLRDRLIVNEAAHLGAQLPMLIRGFYYEGWHPAKTPRDDLHNAAQFIQAVRHELRNAAVSIDPEHAIRAVFKLLREKVTQGEIQDIKGELPKDLQELWPPG